MARKEKKTFKKKSTKDKFHPNLDEVADYWEV